MKTFTKDELPHLDGDAHRQLAKLVDYRRHDTAEVGCGQCEYHYWSSAKRKCRLLAGMKVQKNYLCDFHSRLDHEPLL